MRLSGCQAHGGPRKTLLSWPLHSLHLACFLGERRQETSEIDNRCNPHKRRSELRSIKAHSSRILNVAMESATSDPPSCGFCLKISPLGHARLYSAKDKNLLSPLCALDRWLWVKNMYPKWNPGKWNQGLKPVVP